MKRIFFLITFSFLLFGYNANAQCLKVDDELQALFEKKKEEMDNLKKEIEAKVDAETNDVSINSSGVPSYENWVRFLQIGETIEQLDAQWDDAYGNSMQEFIAMAIKNGLLGDEPPLRDCAEDLIEETYFTIEEEYASIYFESKFNSKSFRLKMLSDENEWIEKEEEMEFNPLLTEELDEMSWPLVTSDNYGCEIRNTEIDEAQLDSYVFALSKPHMFTNSKFALANYSLSYLSPYYFESIWKKLSKILGKVKPVAEVIGVVVGVIKIWAETFPDCAASKNIKVIETRNNGFEVNVNGNTRKIGYKLKQHGKFFDWKATVTSIIGKAKIYKVKSNGKVKKKDRNSKVGLELCLKEYDVCNKTDFPVDGSAYVYPAAGATNRYKKVTISDPQPFALVYNKTTHFLKFSFFAQEVYQKTIPLLSNGLNPNPSKCRD